jgi:hypothetical protein
MMAICVEGIAVVIQITGIAKSWLEWRLVPDKIRLRWKVT